MLRTLPPKMALRTLSASNAAALDSELMSTGAFSIDQLMELAGLSVAQLIYKLSPPSTSPRILLTCGPGNNGGDGLVAARHLHHFGYSPTVHYPKRPNKDIYQRLIKQLEALEVPFTSDFEASLRETDHVVDAVFGFSFKGEVRDPFGDVIRALESTSVPVTAVDAPSSWDIEGGPPGEGTLGHGYMPSVLISLTAAKPLVRWFTGRHFVGGRGFLPRAVAEKFGVDVPGFKGDEMVVEVAVEGMGQGQGEKL